MMLTIHGLPTSTTYQELKRLIKQECSITDFILDSLVIDDDGCKKVRIGVTDDGDGSHLIKYLNGYHYAGHMIRVVPIGKPNQQTQGNFHTSGGYHPRNDYQPSGNYGNRPMSLDQQSARWGSNAQQWGQNVAPQVPQNTFPNQAIQPVINNSFAHQQPRGFVPGVVPQLQQSFGYAAKSNVPENNLMNQGSSQFHHQPVVQGHFQGQSHVQSTSWSSQVQPVKPAFEKSTPGYNQIGFSDSRQILKQGNEGYKEYEKGDRRFGSQRDLSPGRRSRMSPGPSGRRMSPTGTGRRTSPAGHQSRRMSPSGSHGRRMSPAGSVVPGRRMSPSRMGGSTPIGRGVSPDRKLSPQGRRMSPGSYRRMSPSGPHRSSPGSNRASPHGGPGRRDASPGRRMSPADRRRVSPGRESPGRRGSPSRRMSPKRHSPGRRSVSPRRRSPLLDAPGGMRGSVEGNEEMVEENVESSELLVEDNINKEPGNTDYEEDVRNSDDADVKQFLADKETDAAFYKPEVREMFKRLSGARRKRFKILIADNVPWEEAIEMCQKRWSQLPPNANPKKRARLEKMKLIMSGERPQVVVKNYFLKSGRCAEVRIQNVHGMTEKQAEILRFTLITKIIQLPKGDGPRFEDYGYKGGVLTVSCRDKQSQVWLQSIVSQLEPWPGARLTATIVRIPPKQLILNVLLPASETTDISHAFTMFKVQNRGLNTEEWVLLSSEPVRGGTLVYLSVDQRSAEVLKEANFKACLGFKTVRFSRPGGPPVMGKPKVKAYNPNHKNKRVCL